MSEFPVVKCPVCGVALEPYEIFACRIRGLKRPVCLGCLVKTVIWLHDEILPMLNAALGSIEELAGKRKP